MEVNMDLLLAGRKGERSCGVGCSRWNFLAFSLVSSMDCSRLNGGGDDW